MQIVLPGPKVISSSISPFLAPARCDGISFEPGQIVRSPELPPSIPMSVQSSSFAGPPLSRTCTFQFSFALAQ